MPKHKYIEEPETLSEYFENYKTDLIQNPRTRQVLCQKTGEMVDEHLRRPFTYEGFCVFCYQNYKVTVHHYFDNPDGSYDKYREVCSRIRQEIRQDQIEGGMVGQFNHSITQRLNGLVEKTENKHEVQGPVKITMNLNK